ncbi:hypothetical protein D3C73_1468200 [compost metagenome]
MNRVAAHGESLLSAVQRHRLGVITHSTLGRRIGRRTRNANQARSRGDVDNGTGSVRPHGANGVLATQEHAIEIGLVHGVPVFQARMLRVMP